LQKINTATLDDAQRQQHQQIAAAQTSAVSAAHSTTAANRPDIEAAAAKITQFSMYRIIGLIVLLVVGVAVLFNSSTWFLGILIIAGALIAHRIVVGNQKKQASLLAERNYAPAREALGVLGQPAGGLTDATG